MILPELEHCQLLFWIGNERSWTSFNVRKLDWATRIILAPMWMLFNCCRYEADSLSRQNGNEWMMGARTKMCPVMCECLDDVWLRTHLKRIVRQLTPETHSPMTDWELSTIFLGNPKAILLLVTVIYTIGTRDRIQIPRRMIPTLGVWFDSLNTNCCHDHLRRSKQRKKKQAALFSFFLRFPSLLRRRLLRFLRRVFQPVWHGCPAARGGRRFAAFTVLYERGRNLPAEAKLTSVQGRSPHCNVHIHLAISARQVFFIACSFFFLSVTFILSFFYIFFHSVSLIPLHLIPWWSVHFSHVIISYVISVFSLSMSFIPGSCSWILIASSSIEVSKDNSQRRSELWFVFHNFFLSTDQWN